MKAVVIFISIICLFLTRQEENLEDFYFTLSKVKVQAFESVIQHSIVDNLKVRLEGKSNKIPFDDLEVVFTYNTDKGFSNRITGLEQIDDPKLKEILKDLYSGVDVNVIGFFEIWDIFANGRLFSSPKMTESKNHFVIKDEDGILSVELQNEEVIKKLIIEKVDGQIIELLPDFKNTPSGYLLSGYRAKINNGVIKMEVQISYLEGKNYYLPKKVEMSVLTVDKKHEVYFSCTNYKLSFTPSSLE